MKKCISYQIDDYDLKMLDKGYSYKLIPVGADLDPLYAKDLATASEIMRTILKDYKVEVVDMRKLAFNRLALDKAEVSKETMILYDLGKSLDIDSPFTDDDIYAGLETIISAKIEGEELESLLDSIYNYLIDSDIDTLADLYDVVFNMFDKFPVLEQVGIDRYEVIEDNITSVFEDEGWLKRDMGYGAVYWTFKFGDEEYIIFENYDDAKRYAINYEKDLLMDEPEEFRDFLIGYAFISSNDKIKFADEEAWNYVEDKEDEEILEEAGLLDDYKTALERGDEKKSKEILRQARDEIYDEMYEYYYDNIDKYGVYFLIDEYGFTEEEVFDMPMVLIDFEEAARDVVKVEGAAMVLASYDHREIETEQGFFVYRVN